MELAFYVSSLVAIAATFMVITRTNAVHALLYLVVSLLSVAVVLFTLGAPFVAALEVIVYAGASMVFFVFVVMMLNLGQQSVGQEQAWLTPSTWVGPAILCTILIIEMAYGLFSNGPTLAPATTQVIAPQLVGIALFGPYIIGVELASLLLLAGLVGAYHLGRREREPLQHPGEAPQMTAGNGYGRESEIHGTESGTATGSRIREKV